MVSKKTPKKAAKKPAAKKPAAKKPAAKKPAAKKPAAKKPAAKKPAAAKPAPKKAAAKKVAKAAAPLDASAQIDKKIAELGDWRGQLMAEIRALIHEVDPEVVEEWKWMGTPTWSHAGIYAITNAHKDKVKITFAHGAALADPNELFNAGLDGNKWRAIDLFEGDAIDEPKLGALFREAIAYNESKSGKPVKKSAAKKTSAAKTVTAKLLSGGNPQIAKADGDAPVQAYIAALPGWKREVGRRLDALIERTLPGVRKAVKWNSPFYGVEGQGWFLGFHCFTKYVKVSFFRGTALRPMPPGPSKSEDTRYLDIHENDELDEKLVANWILQASKLPGWSP